MREPEPLVENGLRSATGVRTLNEAACFGGGASSGKPPVKNLLTDEHRAWIGQAEAPITVEVSRRDIIKYSIATEQTQLKYLAGDEAPPMFVFNLFSPLAELKDFRTDGLPKGRGGGPRLPLQRVMAGGTEIRQHRPIRPGDRLVGTRSITDLFEKQGSTGPLIFTRRTLHVTDEAGAPVLDEIQTSINR